MANVRSLSDLNGEGSDDDNKKHNDYYAGGEKSGQLIRGADSSDDEGDDPVSGLFSKARRAGAQQGTAADMPSAAPVSSFRGQARTLAGGPPQEAAPGAAAAGSAAAEPSDRPRAHVITFYRNGVFTVDDGPGRRIDDPANLPFIESISRGECPAELEPGDPNTPINVNLVRKDEDYTEPARPAYTAFTGTGRTLAGPSTSSTAAAAAAAAEPAGEWRGVDESQPTTSLQLRLADGSRMVAKFNHTHLVSDIRRFIRAARPDVTWPYQLLTSFPTKVLEDETQTLAAAGLLNAVITQKRV